MEDSVEDIGREHETGAAASFEGGAGRNVSLILKRIVIFLTQKRRKPTPCASLSCGEQDSWHLPVTFHRGCSGEMTVH